jgi:hypothetical protein
MLVLTAKVLAFTMVATLFAQVEPQVEVPLSMDDLAFQVSADGQNNGIVPRLSDSEVEKAIALGKRYRDPDKLWRHEFEKTNGFKLTSWYWAAHVRLYTDRAMIATSAALAAHEMRGFSVEDARSLPSLGKIRVALLTADAGYYHNATSDPHLVLELDGRILQPEVKNQVDASAQHGRITPRHYEHAETLHEFVFPTSYEIAANGRLLLITGDNKQHAFTLDFKTLR